MINMDLDNLKFQMDINSFIEQWMSAYQKAFSVEKYDGIEVVFRDGFVKRYFDFWIEDMETVTLEDEIGIEDTIKFKDIDELR
ncbi:MAG: hypothetical protein M0Z70_11720 [Nitrospiraceae bacterium]|nr:hypothetical protein [Nitrospiraceae bacterium]